MQAFYSVMMSTPLIVTVITLAVYSALGNELTASTAFPAMALLQLLREPLARYPYVLTNLFVEGRTALDRLESFLNTESPAPYLQLADAPRPPRSGSSAGASEDPSLIAVRITKGTFRWTPEIKTAWQAGQRGAWEKIVGYKTMAVGCCKLLGRCFGCGRAKAKAAKE
eukprot:SAG11_NODE_10373_length_836_cov_1.264586_1_plen_167_part_10